MIVDSVPSLNEETVFFLKENLGEVFEELKTAFIEDGNALIEQAEVALKKNDEKMLGVAIHTLKSSARNMGADKMAGCCASIEDMIDAGKLHAATKYLSEIKQEMQAIVSFLNHLD